MPETRGPVAKRKNEINTWNEKRKLARSVSRVLGRREFPTNEEWNSNSQTSSTHTKANISFHVVLTLLGQPARRRLCSTRLHYSQLNGSTRGSHYQERCSWSKKRPRGWFRKRFVYRSGSTTAAWISGRRVQHHQVPKTSKPYPRFLARALSCIVTDVADKEQW